MSFGGWQNGTLGAVCPMCRGLEQLGFININKWQAVTQVAPSLTIFTPFAPSSRYSLIRDAQGRYHSMKDHMGIWNFSLRTSWNLVLMGSPIFSLFSMGGISSFRQMTCSQSTSANQGCSLIDSASFSKPSRFYGFWESSFLTRSLKSSGVFLVNLITPLRTSSQSSCLVSAQYGGQPVKSSQRTTPYSYQSAMRVCPFLLMIQRGRQAGVPQKDLLIASRLSVFLERPKSVMSACPSRSNTIFSGFRSRYMMPCLCSASKPSSISQAQFLTCCSVNFFLFYSRRERSPPSQQSMAKKRQVSVWKAQRRRTMKGWLSRLRISFSVWMQRYKFVPQTLSFLMAFKARKFSCFSRRTRQTSPKAPSPIFLQNLNDDRVMVYMRWFSLMNWYSLNMCCLRQKRASLPYLACPVGADCSDWPYLAGASWQFMASIFSIMLRWLFRFRYIRSSSLYCSYLYFLNRSAKLAEARSIAVIPVQFFIRGEAPCSSKA